MLKKLLLLTAAAAGLAFAKQKMDESQQEQARWHSATDTVPTD